MKWKIDAGSQSTIFDNETEYEISDFIDPEETDLEDDVSITSFIKQLRSPIKRSKSPSRRSRSSSISSRNKSPSKSSSRSNFKTKRSPSKKKKRKGNSYSVYVRPKTKKQLLKEQEVYEAHLKTPLRKTSTLSWFL